MPYSIAKECFKDGQRYLHVQNDPVYYDILAGLQNLTEALESDREELKYLLSEIRDALRALAA